MIKRTYKVQREVVGKCRFCEEKKQPSYKDLKMLQSLLTEKGKIISRLRNGLCLQHQKKAATSIKRARQLALLPYVTVIK